MFVIIHVMLKIERREDDRFPTNDLLKKYSYFRLQVLNSAGRLKGSLNKNEPQIDGLIVLSEWSQKKHPIA